MNEEDKTNEDIICFVGIYFYDFIIWSQEFMQSLLFIFFKS